MNPRAGARWVGLLAGLLSMAASAAEPGTAEVERERIRSERAAANAQFDEAARACQDRFAVTDCVNAARQVQRDTLASLRRQESVLEEAARRQRAAQRMADIRAKVSAQESRAKPPATSARRNSAIRVAPPRDLPAPRAGRVAPATPRVIAAPAGRASEPPTAAAERAERERVRRAAFEAKARSAQAHRDAARQRTDERSRKGKASQPLPQDPAAAAP